jgi:hypothetical protein
MPGRRTELEDVLGDLGERPHEHLAVRLPACVQDGVPRTHRLLVRDRDRDRTRGWAIRSGYVLIIECGHAASFVGHVVIYVDRQMTYRRTVTRRKVAGMDVPLSLVFCSLKSASSSVCRSAWRPSEAAAANAFIVGP